MGTAYYHVDRLAGEKVRPSCRSCTNGVHCPFRPLKEELRHTLERQSQRRVVARGEQLWGYGSLADGIYVIHKGLVKITATGPAGRDQILRLAGDGDVAGCVSMLQAIEHTTAATVLEPTRLCFIPKPTVQRLLEADRNLFVRLLSSVSVTLGAVESRLVEITRKSVSERLALALLQFQDCYGTETDEATLRLRMKREDLAGFVGTTLESVSRLLARFREDGMIYVKGRRITIRDRQALATLGRVTLPVA